ncbi:cupredoxin domain-containing protein [Bacillus sp. PS06]|nr:cupredoxin domain-containing protein [Bacillus sp. PS06]
MQGMVLTMTIGMNVGLTSGVLFGVLLQGNLYVSTLLSIMVGTIASIVCGISLGLLPSIEGFMSGLMGGMMGAMLGEMVTKDQADTLVKILLTLTVCSLFLFIILPSSKDCSNTILKKRWYLKPISAFILIFTFFILGNNLNNDLTSTNLNHSHGDSSSQHEEEITLHVSESTFSYAPSKIIMKENKPITLILKNRDSIDHAIVIKELPFNNLSESDSHSHDKHNQGEIHLHTPSNSEGELTFTPLKQGIYTFYCTVPGHSERGMIGQLVVEG